MVGLNRTCGLDVLEDAARILGDTQGWDDDRRDREITDYRQYIRRFDVPGRADAPAPVAAQ